MAPKQALIFGASGISGWAIARECLRYPTTETFGRVFALSNQKLEKKQFLLQDVSQEKLDLFCLDLCQDTEVVSSQFAAIVVVKETTHVYYVGEAVPPYAGYRSEHEGLKEINVKLFENALKAVLAHYPKLEFFSQQGILL